MQNWKGAFNQGQLKSICMTFDIVHDKRSVCLQWFFISTCKDKKALVKTFYCSYCNKKFGLFMKGNSETDSQYFVKPTSTCSQRVFIRTDTWKYKKYGEEILPFLRNCLANICLFTMSFHTREDTKTMVPKPSIAHIVIINFAFFYFGFYEYFWSCGNQVTHR